ncbi:MAG TPA: hypothetical protein DCZ89_06135 [Geobacter sulfurreducens]|nr:hypothetical protein [Geobacter sulfurreducens]
MQVSKLKKFCCLVVVAAGVGMVDHALAAELPVALETGTELKEMPVLDGESWQSMSPDAKIAFIWGVGHVVTIEEHVIQRHPELLRKDFVAKLGDGLRGVPMSSIIEQVDGYYRQNPDDLDLPVMRVIWSEVVRPRLKAGIADQPFREQ